MNVDAIFCISSDPWKDPHGGQAKFAEEMLNAFGDRLAVASVTKENLPLRQWIERPFKGKKIKFLNMGKMPDEGSKKPIIPLRLVVYYYSLKSMPNIYSAGIRNIFLESPETLFAAANYKWNSVCYRFAGVNNPIENSRYLWARIFGKIFERYFFLRLKKINVDSMLASADRKSINELVNRSKGILDKSVIHHFPTRVDTENFKPISKEVKRKELNLSDELIIVTCGRLSWVKGWNLILNSMVYLKNRIENFKVIFVGDGEDRFKLLKKSKELKVYDKLLVTGFIPNKKVSSYINAADLCIVSSYKEGWSLAMLEMIACGKSVVSTDVSGAKDMIINGANGFVVKERNPIKYADAICKAINLKESKEVSLRIANKYSTKNIAHDLGHLWKPLS